MIKKFLHQIIRRRHFWRDANFDELTELYVSSMLRTFALSLMGVFLPFYLYQNGYDIAGIFMFFGVYFSFRIIADIGASYYVARFGPKHTIIASYALQLVFVALLLSLPSYHWSAGLVAPVFGASASFFFIAYHVEFSKIKHSKNAGKELGEMQVFEKVAAIAGPLFGGLAGTLFGSQYIFILATLVLFASLWPLFRTAETVRVRQSISFRLLPLPKVKYDLLSYAGLGIENSLCIVLWPLYISLFALGGEVYARLGTLSSLAVLSSVAAAYMIGRYIDKRDARRMLRISAIINAAVYSVRPFVHSIIPALFTSIANEIITTGYRIPFMKGMYAAADDLPGCRIVYVASMESIASITKATVWFILAILAGAMSDKSVIFIGFAIASVASLLVTTERFKALGGTK